MNSLVVDEGSLADGLFLFWAGESLDQSKAKEGGCAGATGGDKVAVDGNEIFHLLTAVLGDAVIAAWVAACLLALDDLAGFTEKHSWSSADGADDLAGLEVALDRFDDLGVFGEVGGAWEAAWADDAVECLASNLFELDFARHRDIVSGFDGEVATDCGDDNFDTGAAEEVDRSDGFDWLKTWSEKHNGANH